MNRTVVDDRLTPDAMRVTYFAAIAASNATEPSIDTHHLLEGLLIVDGIPRSVLADVGLEPPDPMPTLNDLDRALVYPDQFNEHAAKVMELALREALQLGHAVIRPEHILLAIIRYGQGSAVDRLFEASIDLGVLRRLVISAITGAHYADLPSFSTRSTDIMQEIRRERVRAHSKHGKTSMESKPADHPLRLAILGEEYGEVCKEFNEAEHEERPVDLQRLRKELVQVAAMAAAWADAIPVP